MQHRESTHYTKLGNHAISQHPTMMKSDMESKRWQRWRFSWNKCVEMTTLIIAGIAAALGHLFFYRHLTGGPVDGPFLLSQEWNIRIGTGLAFLSKTCWTVAILVAQAQHAWTTLERKELDVVTIDAMLLAPVDITQLVKCHRLRHAKIATLLALAAWLMPLSAIFTPATLTVERKLFASDVTNIVPTIDFNNVSSYASVFLCMSGSSCPRSQNPDRLNPAVLFSSPSPRTLTPVVIAASTGQIQGMVPEVKNSSYQFAFHGPTIRCSQAEPDLASTIRRIDTTVNIPYSKSRSLYDKEVEVTPISYNCFVPAKLDNGTTTAVDWAKFNMELGTADSLIPEAPELWIRHVSYNISNYYICALYNASYDATFTFENERQYTKYSAKPLNKMAWQPALLGDIQVIQADNRNFGIDKSENPQIFAYQGIWMALAQQLVGRIFTFPLNTNVAQTSIMGSKEFRGRSGDVYVTRNKTIPEMIEELSDNVTLSLLASKQHLSPVGVETLVHVSESRNVYAFNQQTLLLSYGIALLVASAAFIVGLIAYRTNGGSRSLTFSALVQAAKDKKLNISTVKT